MLMINLKAQDTTIYVVTGKIIDGETLTPVPYCLLLNTNKMFAAQSDTSGNYRILIMKGDEVKITCIGYVTTELKVDFSKAVNRRISQTVYLAPQTYPIGAVNIYSLRWKSLVYNVKNTNVEKDKNKEKIQNWVNNLVVEQNLTMLNPKSGIQIMLPTFSHFEKQQQKIENQMKIDEQNKLADEKFNSELVSQITGLKGNELSNFMRYCSFDRDFILRTSQYDLIIIIKDIYAEYKNQKN